MKQPMTIHLIMTLSENGIISNKWDLPLNRQWLQMNIFGGVVIMTLDKWESLYQQPFQGCFNIIVTNTTVKGAYQCSTLIKALKVAASHSSSVYIIGGDKMYCKSLSLKIVDILIITCVHDQIYSKSAIYAILPFYKTLKWSSKTFHYKNICFNLKLYRILKKTCLCL